MIKCDKSNLEIAGSVPAIMTELTAILKGLMESGIEEEEILDALRMSKMTEEEVDNEIKGLLFKKMMEGKYFL